MSVGASLSRRGASLLVASVLIVVLGLVGAFLPVPYVALQPGPTKDTLEQPKGKPPLIEIKGRQTYPTDGHLNFVTVAYSGGPGRRIDLFTALRGWIDPKVAIVPEETIFPKNESVKEVERENTQQMATSQETATAAALKELRVPVGKKVTIESVQQGMPADGKLRPGDEVLAVDKAKISGGDSIRDALSKHKPGQQVRVTVKRDGKETAVTVQTTRSPDNPSRPVLGIRLGERFKFPFEVKITIGNVGGPSAGLMFALAIYDKLTPGSLTGGKFIAGTGTITAEGKVGPIGGIQQKMIAARKAGATVFLTPADNCASAAKAAPKGLRLVKADTMNSALSSLNALRAGQGNVPPCS